MRLLLRRGQKSSMLGKAVFTLDVRAELTPDESASLGRYKMGKEIIYHEEKVDTSKIEQGTWRGLGRAVAARMLNLTITVDDLAQGRHIECKDILEMLAAEDQIKEAAQTFRNILHAAAHFGGEEVVEV
jgi:hypothetical protein